MDAAAGTNTLVPPSPSFQQAFPDVDMADIQDQESIQTPTAVVSSSATAVDMIETAVNTRPRGSALVPEFVGKVLMSRDGKCVVPYLSRCFNWSFSVAWMSDGDPLTWLHTNSMELLRVPDARRARSIDTVFMPLVEVLVHKNKSMVKFMTTGNSGTTFPEESSNALITPTSPLELKPYQVNQEVMRIAFETANQLDDIGKGTAGDILTTVCTTHVLTQLLDKITWASELYKRGKGPLVISLDEDFAAIDQPLPIGRYYSDDLESTKKSKIDAIVNWHKKVHAGWREITQKFIQDWDGYQEQKRKDKTSPQLGGDSEALPDSNTILKELFADSGAYKKSAKIAKALSRIHEAVLALGSFRLFDLNQALENKKDFCFHEALLYVLLFSYKKL